MEIGSDAGKESVGAALSAETAGARCIRVGEVATKSRNVICHILATRSIHRVEVDEFIRGANHLRVCDSSR